MKLTTTARGSARHWKETVCWRLSMKVGDLVRFKMNHNRLFVVRAIANEKMFGKEVRVVFVGPDSWPSYPAKELEVVNESR
jgi:hypothetical protein